MAIDFESIISKHVGEDGSIPAAAISKLTAAISSAVGREFVTKDRYNAKLEEIETLKTEKQTAEDTATAAAKWEKKFDDLKTEFDSYKASTDAKEKLASVKSAYRKLLEGAGIDGKRIDTIIRATVFDGLKLGEDGKFPNETDLMKAIDADWGDFKVSTSTTGAKVDTPPDGSSNPTGANSRAAELAKQYAERRYGRPENANSTNDKH